MNVVLVNDFAHVNGGVGQVVLSSAKALAQRGHAVTLFTAVLPRDPSLDCANLAVVCTEQHEIATDPDRLRAAIQGLWNVPAQRAMRRLLEGLDRRDTVIHFHGWTKALSASVIRACLVQGFKTVTTLHEYFSACPNGGFFNYQTQQNCELVPLSAACIRTHCDARSYPQKLWRVGRQFVQQSAGMLPRGMRHFISVTEFSAAVLKPYLPEEARIHPVANPIDVVRAEPVDVQDHLSFVCVGRLSPEKGGPLLARAAHALGVQVTFVGEGPMRDEIIAANADAHLAGWLPAQGVKAEVRKARALVLPSLWYETQGLVVNEAAALGVPAIVPDGCAARESVVDGITGLWFRSGNQVDLQDKIRILQTQPLLAKTMGRAAYERYWQRPPTLQNHVIELERVYGAILADR